MTDIALTAETPGTPVAASGVAADDRARPWPRPAYAWYVVVVLLVAYGFAVLDRTAIGLLVDSIKSDLGISDSQIGLLQGLAFAICYTTCGIPLGFLADRWRRKPLLAIGIAVWSAATVLCGAARSFGMLFLARVGVGVGEASVTPTSISLIADYFPPERRAKAYSVWMLGSSLGTGMAMLFAAGAISLSDHLHATGVAWAEPLKTWQITFFLIGAPGLLVSLVFALTVREPARRGVSLAADGSPLVTGVSLKPLWVVMKANRRAYLALIGGPVLNVTAIYAQIGWMPALFMRVHHWGPAKYGAVNGLISVPVAMCGAIAAGWTMSYLTSKGRNDAPILMAMGDAAVRLLIGVAACLAPRPEIALALIVAASVTSTWSYASAMTGLSQITPNELRGQVAALYTLCTGLISMTLGSFIVGFLSDHVFHGPTGVAGSLATTFAGCSLLALLVLIPGRKFYAAAEQRIRIAEQAA
jgi:MFS family permease